MQRQQVQRQQVQRQPRSQKQKWRSDDTSTPLSPLQQALLARAGVPEGPLAAASNPAPDPSATGMYADIPRELSYEPNKIPVMNVKHVGWVKLLLNEIWWLAELLPRADARAVVVYAGSAPATKIPALSQLFPGVVWVLADPNEHVLMCNTSRGVVETALDVVAQQPAIATTKPAVPLAPLYIAARQSRKSAAVGLSRRGTLRTHKFDDKRIIMMRNGAPCELYSNSDEVAEANREAAADNPAVFERNLKAALLLNKNVIVVEAFADESMCGAIGRAARECCPGAPLLFISDIRRCANAEAGADEDDDSAPSDIDKVANMAQMYIWMLAMRPDAAMLKFTAPYMLEVGQHRAFPNPADNPAIIPEYARDLARAAALGYNPYESYLAGVFLAPAGELHLQAFAGPASSETRLWVNMPANGGPIPCVEYSPREYEGRMFYYNRVVRELTFHETAQPYFNPQVGLDACGDCALATSVVRGYFNKFWPAETAAAPGGAPAVVVRAIACMLAQIDRNLGLQKKGRRVFDHGKFYAPHVVAQPAAPQTEGGKK